MAKARFGEKTLSFTTLLRKQPCISSKDTDIVMLFTANSDGKKDKNLQPYSQTFSPNEIGPNLEKGKVIIQNKLFILTEMIKLNRKHNFILERY